MISSNPAYDCVNLSVDLKDTYQENVAYSEKIISEIAGDDLTPIGLMGSDLQDNIKLFIKNRHLDIKKDIHQIVDTLENKLIIRRKSGGVCIRTLLMPCVKDNKTNEVLCAHNFCPNLFQFYYMADLSYLEFKTLQEIYAEHLSTGHTRAAQKDLEKIRDLLRRKLVPELTELDREIKRKGNDSVINRNPSLSTLIYHESAIKKEISLWITRH